MSEIAKFLPYWCRQQNDEQIDIAWKNWLKTYITNRFQGIPRDLDSEEQKALICLVPSLRGHISEALEILSTTDNTSIDFSQDHYPVPEGYDEKEQQQLLLFINGRLSTKPANAIQRCLGGGCIGFSET